MASPGGSHPGRVGGETAARGRGDGSGQRDRDRKNGESRGKNQMDAKTKKALEGAFAPSKQQAEAQSMRDLENINKAREDAEGTGGFWDAVGKALGMVSPVEEADPYDDPDFVKVDGEYPTKANWKADMGEALGTAIGLGVGVPGIGTITGELNDLAGKPIPDVNLGPDVFGGGSTGKAPPVSGSDGEPKELVNDQFGQPTTPAAPPKPPAGPVGLPDIWEYPEEADLAASAPQDGLSDEERRRRGNTSIVVLGQGGLAI